MEDLIVSKYGGSSITKYEDIERIKKITCDDPRRKIIIVSAPGKRDEKDAKITDLLISLAKDKDSSLVQLIIGRYKMLCPTEDANDLSDLLQQRLSQSLEDDKYLDSLKSFGEEACAKLIAKKINAQFVDPRELFLVSEDYGNAKILKQSEEMIKKRLASKKEIFVVPGFYGYTEQGNIATFNRGGSDLTGAYIAASLNAKEYENFTDIDGICAANPDIVQNPKKIDVITFDEMRDLAYSGFGIFYEEAINPVNKKRIPVHVRSTFNYPSEGTYIVHDRLSDPDKPIAGVAYKDGFCTFDIALFGLNGMIGIARKILQIFEEEKISIEFITTAIDDFSVIFREDQLKHPFKDIRDITEKLYSLMGEDASINFQEHLGSLVVAGKGLKEKKGIFANIQQTLAEADVNIKFISKGPLERSIIYGINSSDTKKAVNAIYNKYLR